MIFDYFDLGKDCAKILILVLNGGCVLLAISCLIFTVVDLNTLNQYSNDTAIGIGVADIIIMVASMLLISIAAFGSVGAIRGNFKVLYTYVGLLMMMVVLQMLIAIYVSVHRYGLAFRLSEWLREDFFRNVTDDNAIVHKSLWDSLQITHKCCGFNGPEDYTAFQKHISISCCPRAYRVKSTYAKQQLYRFCIQTTNYYNVGCEDKVLQHLKANSNWLIAVAVTCFWFEAAGMLLAMWLAKNAKNEMVEYKKSNSF